MGSFREEGWVCVHPYAFDHYVTKAMGGTLCGAHGWSYGPGLRGKPLDFKPTCKKCEALLEARKEQDEEEANDGQHH